MSGNFRTGIGYDIHPLVENRELVLGGIKIPFEKGLDGWSDADVLTHALIDALLGAGALGDIGTHFPPGDPTYRGISSIKLLELTVDKLDKAGLGIINIDVTIIAERPKLKEYISPMRSTLGRTLGIGIDKISIKASTANGVGFIGSEKGIAALVVATLENSTKYRFV